MPAPTYVSLACARIVVETLVDEVAVRPLGHDDLLHVNRLTTGDDGIHRALIERHIVADTGRRHVEPFPLLDPAQELLSRLMFAANPFVGGLALSCITMS
jgi:hypothetical protein